MLETTSVINCCSVLAVAKTSSELLMLATPKPHQSFCHSVFLQMVDLAAQLQEYPAANEISIPWLILHISTVLS